MDAQKLIEAGLQSPVLVALIPGIIAIVGGRWIVQAKDAQLKVKDEQIAALERWMPANIAEQLEATKKVYQLRLDDANATIDILTNQGLSEQQKRERLETVVAEYREQVEQLNGQLESTRKFQDLLALRLYVTPTNPATARDAAIAWITAAGDRSPAGTYEHLRRFLEDREGASETGEAPD